MAETAALAEGTTAGTAQWTVTKAEVGAHSGNSPQPRRGPTPSVLVLNRGCCPDILYRGHRPCLHTNTMAPSRREPTWPGSPWGSFRSGIVRTQCTRGRQQLLGWGRELWPFVLVSKVGNGQDPNQTFCPHHCSEREPIEFGERTARQRPMGADEVVDKESNQGQTQQRWIWGTRAIFSCCGETPLPKLRARFVCLFLDPIIQTTGRS